MSIRRLFTAVPSMLSGWAVGGADAATSVAQSAGVGGIDFAPEDELGAPAIGIFPQFGRSCCADPRISLSA